MSEQKYYDFSELSGEEIEILLVELRSLIRAKKITNNLPNDLQTEIDEINDKVDIIDNFINGGIDCGTYTHEHLYEEWISLDEDNHVRMCVCGDEEIKPHNWNNGEITTSATHMIYGLKTYVCDDCGFIKTEQIPKLSEHTYSNWVQVDETYHGKSCECGALIKEEHDWNEGVVAIEPTSTNTGIMKYTCTICGGTKEEEIPSLITFTIISTSGTTLYYSAEQGMTWDEFIDSEYNTGTEIISRHGIISDGIQTYYPGIGGTSFNRIDIREKGTTVLKTSVSITDVIVELDDTEEYYAHYATCLVGDTQVFTSLDGNKKEIKEFQSGDTVVSYNLNTGENYLSKVTRLVVNENSVNMAKITFENGVVLNMTTEHPILTRNGFGSVCAWADYFELAIGDEVKTIDGWSVVTMIEQYILDEPVCTYTLGVVDYNEDPDVDTYDNFYANGIVVHNKIF